MSGTLLGGLFKGFTTAYKMFRKEPVSAIFSTQIIDTIENKKGVIVMSATKFLAGFIVGGAIGAIAGVLLAPKSGEETRALIADSAKDAVRRADETVKEIQSKADDVVSDMQRKGDEIKEKLQNLINQQKEAKQEA